MQEYELENEINHDVLTGLVEDALVNKIVVDDVEFIGTQEQITETFVAWNKYLKEIKNPNTTMENTFFKVNGKNAKYAPLSEVLNTVKPVLAKYGFSFFQIPSFNNGCIFTKFILTHINGTIISFPKLSVPAAEKITAQNIGSAISYIRRYQINSICGVSGEDDDGNLASDKDVEASQDNKKKPKQEDELVKLKQELLNLCKQKAEVDRNAVDELIKSHETSGRVGNIKDEKTIKKLIENLKEID